MISVISSGNKKDGKSGDIIETCMKHTGFLFKIKPASGEDFLLFPGDVIRVGANAVTL